MPLDLRKLDLRLVDALAVPASVHDVEGVFIRANAAAERAAGYSNAELRGRHYLDLLRPEARENVEKHFRRTVERSEPAEFETVFVDKGGNLRGVRAQHLPLRDGDDVVGVLILAFEVRRLPAEPADAARDPHLTPRQLEILDLIGAGLSTSEVAKELTLSKETVRNHLRNASRELGAHTRLEAIAAAHRLGLLSPHALGPRPS